MTENGYVIVDRSMKTSINEVYAAGDITSFPRACLTGLNNKKEDSENVSIAHWGLASQQGETTWQIIYFLKFIRS